MTKRTRGNRYATVMALVVVGMPVLLLCVAFTVDLGFVIIAKQQLQAAADAGALGVHIANLRAKLAEAGAEPDLIRNVRSFGYKLAQR